MLKSKIISQQSVFFFSLIFVWLAYIATLVVLTHNIGHSCFILIFNRSGLHTATSIFQSRAELYINIVVVLLCFAAWIKIIKALLATLFKFLITKNYINSLVITYGESFNVIHNLKNSAFTFGLLSPEIYISSNLLKKLSNKEKQVLLIHEIQHVKNKDPFKVLILHFLKKSTLYFPGKSYLFYKYDLLSEILADKMIDNFPKLEFINLCSKLLNLKTKKILFSSGYGNKISRIDYLTGNKRFSLLSSVGIIVIIMSLLSLISITTIRAKPFNRCEEFHSCVSEYNTNYDNSTSEAVCISIVYTSKDKNFSTF